MNVGTADFTALTFTPVSFVAPIREISVLLMVLAGNILLGEGELKRHIGWAIIILIGMHLLVTASRWKWSLKDFFDVCSWHCPVDFGDFIHAEWIFRSRQSQIYLSDV